MIRKPLALSAICCLILLPIQVFAVTHDVMVGNNFFSPNDLTIEVGDTVRWTNNSGRMHDVVADDFSWASQTSSSFVFERTFNSVEEVLYHCTVHSSPGRNIDSNQNGRITVQEPAQTFVLINGGMTDAWLDPATAGQGFFIIVWEDIEYIFLSWFTFDTERPPGDVTAIFGEPGHRWVTAQGPYDGDTATLDVFLSTGGVFDSEEPVVDDRPNPYGTITIQWTSCEEGILTYNIPSLGLSGQIPIERIVATNVPQCEAGQNPG